MGKKLSKVTWNYTWTLTPLKSPGNLHLTLHFSRHDREFLLPAAMICVSLSWPPRKSAVFARLARWQLAHVKFDFWKEHLSCHFNIGFLVSGFYSFCIMPHDCLLQRVSLSFSLWTSQFKLEGKPKIAIDLIVVMLPFLNYKYELLWQFNVISCLKVYMKITVEPPIMATSLQQLFF